MSSSTPNEDPSDSPKPPPRNRVRCLTCDTIIESKHRHDWVKCACDYDSDTMIYIDGGLAYRRMGAGNNAEWGKVGDDEE